MKKEDGEGSARKKLEAAKKMGREDEMCEKCGGHHKTHEHKKKKHEKHEREEEEEEE